MRMVKRNPFLSGLCAVLGGAFLLTGTALGWTDGSVKSDQAAGIVVYPKLRLDTSAGIDTVIQLSNTSEEQINALCFYINANSHCSNMPTAVCNTSADCQTFGLGGRCVEGWLETDFRIALTPKQPLVWTLGEGMPVGAFPLYANGTSAIPAAPEDPFRGELKCIQVGEDEAPIARNDLKGEATIVTAAEGVLDARAYNAVGIQARENNDGDNVLVLGQDGEYNGCPNIIILDHFFDDARIPDAGIVRTDLTLVPCSENIELQTTNSTTVQFLVFNEFEQRFSTSIPINCFKEIGLSDIGTLVRPFNDDDPASTGDLRSIFNVNVQGTLTGQTRIRGVDDGQEGHGNGLIAVAEEFYRSELTSLGSVTTTAAFNTHQVGERSSSDQITIP